MLAAGGLSAAMALTSFAGEPDYFSEEGEAPAAATQSQPLPSAAVLRWKTSRIERGAEGASNLHPRSSITIIATSHEEEETADAPSRTSAGLRPAFKAPASGNSWNKSKAGSPSNHFSDDGTIRLVAHDAHDDPFGDRAVQAGPALAAPVGARKAALNKPPAKPAAPEAEEPEAAEPMPKAPANLKPVDELPAPGAKDETKDETKEEAEKPATPGTDTFNFRDCSQAEEGCRAFVDSLRGVPLSSISLNIMPHYMPDAETLEKGEAERINQLKTSTSRQWRDRAGKVLATGRFLDLRNGKVIVGDETGAQTAALNVYDISDTDMCFVTAWWRLPGECQSHNAGYLPSKRDWMPSTFSWTASALCHKPLYFEEVQLERYGHTAGPFKQPVLSGAHFFFNIAVLPYKMAINPPMECQYPLGYYRPGDCAPWHIPPIPFSLRGAAAETGAWVGGIFLIP